MFCEKCGSKIEEGTLFCENCGAKVENIEVSAQKSVQKKEISPKAIAIMAGAIAVVAFIAIIWNTLSKTVNLNDYLVVEFMGYDTVGRAQVSFDKDAFEKDYGDKIEFVNKNNITTYLDPTDTLWMCVSWDIDKATNLSNGDEVVFTWNVEDELLESSINLNIKYEDTAFEVSGLEEITTFNPFEGVSVVFSGASPEGSAELIIDSSNSMAEYLDYTLSKDYGLSNGDEIIVTIDCWYDDIAEYCASNYGMVPSDTQKSFTVEGLGEYVTSISDISEETMALMTQQGIDVLNAQVASNWNMEYAKLNSAIYAGSVLLLPKSSDFYLKNKLYMIYEVNASLVDAEYGVSQEVIYYYCVVFNDILKYPDGTCDVDLMDYDTDNSSFYRDLKWGSRSWDYDRYYFSGYESLDELTTQCITTQVAEYTCVYD